jgi:tetratricopeptide (TPR) repeat protein
VRETLRFMGRSPDDRITRDIGREICERQGIRALLTGSIASLGSHYVITLEAVNPRSGDPFAREQIEAESKEKVLSSLGTAAWNLRKKLGESLSMMQKYDVSIEQATTSSLEALKAYAMGNDERAKGNAKAALNFYQRAVELDPNFAMAYARIGVHYGNQQQMEEAKPYVEKAYELRDRVSERERYYITEKYYTYITAEIDKTIETLQTWAKLYPNDFIPHNNLSLNYQMVGRFDDAVKEALEAVRLGPNNISAYDNLVGSYIAVNRLEEAEQSAKELERINPDSLNTHFTKYLFAFLRRDQAGMDRELEWARGKSEEAEVLGTSAGTALYFGKYKQAEELQKRAGDLLQGRGEKEHAAQGFMNLAVNLAIVGKCSEAKNNGKAALSTSRGQSVVVPAVLLYAACDDQGQAQSLLDELRKQYPKSTLVNALIDPIVRTEQERSRGNLDQAVQFMESVRPYDFGLMIGIANNYLRGTLYLKQRRGNEAAAEFRKIIDNPGVDPFSPARPLAHLCLGRALAITGDTAGARKSYQDFFALWKDADPDLPVLVEAKKEYEQLK